jgi:bacillolysin
MKKIIPLINALSILASFNFSAIAQTYCSSKGTNTKHGYIKKVSMETINYTSGNNSGYADFTAQSATLLKGAPYTIELTPGFNPLDYVEYWTVYIDFNHDGMFEPNEIVGEKKSYIRVPKILN